MIKRKRKVAKMNITITKTLNQKNKPDWNNLGFGNFFSDHIFLMNYTPEKSWHDARIVPFANLELSPAIITLSYGQSIFEGLKAYRTDNGKIQLFRPTNNIKRFNSSGERLCIPAIDESLFLQAIKQLVALESDWVPSNEGTSLYLRPVAFGTDERLGVRPSETYLFMILCSPCGAYYAGGMSPIKIYVETKFVRAVKGGIGEAKTGGNYAASLKAQTEASERGYSQVLWLDGREGKYLEEVGAMNVFFVIDGVVVTPMLEGSILSGITRLSAIEILRDKGYKVEERRITIEELIYAAKEGTLTEAFGTGTAAVISPIGEFGYGGDRYIVNNNEIGKVSQALYDELTGIQYGKIEDLRGWIEVISDNIQ